MADRTPQTRMKPAPSKRAGIEAPFARGTRPPANSLGGQLKEDCVGQAGYAQKRAWGLRLGFRGGISSIPLTRAAPATPGANQLTAIRGKNESRDGQKKGG